MDNVARTDYYLGKALQANLEAALEASKYAHGESIVAIDYDYKGGVMWARDVGHITLKASRTVHTSEAEDRIFGKAQLDRLPIVSHLIYNSFPCTWEGHADGRDFKIRYGNGILGLMIDGKEFRVNAMERPSSMEVMERFSSVLDFSLMIEHEKMQIG